MYEIQPTDKPRWFEARRKIAMWLVNLARKIYPRSPEVNAFMSQLMVDAAIYGQAFVRMDPKEMIHEQQNDEG